MTVQPTDPGSCTESVGLTVDVTNESQSTQFIIDNADLGVYNIRCTDSSGTACVSAIIAEVTIDETEEGLNCTVRFGYNGYEEFRIPMNMEWQKYDQSMKPPMVQNLTRPDAEGTGSTRSFSYSLVVAPENRIGVFTCQVEGQPSSYISESIIFVKAPYDLSIKQESIEKGQFILTCQVTAYPEPQIVWFYKEIVLELSNFFVRYDKMTSVTTSAITIDRQKEGDYKCGATNEKGEAHATLAFTPRDELFPLWLALGILAAVIVLAVIITIVVFVIQKNKQRAREHRNGQPGEQMTSMLPSESGSK